MKGVILYFVLPQKGMLIWLVSIALKAANTLLFI